jgi:hypothetical protein
MLLIYKCPNPNCSCKLLIGALQLGTRSVGKRKLIAKKGVITKSEKG